MDPKQFAYSLLETRNFEEREKSYLVTGIASTPTPDRYGDIVEPKGAKFATPMPFLWQHDHREPVGNMTFAELNDDGIPFEAEIPKIVEPGILKDRVDLAVQSVKYNLVNAVSIGFRPLEWTYMENSYDIHFLEWEWLELSLVTIPANSEAVLSAVKSMDQKVLTALGTNAQAARDELLRTKSGDTKGQRRPVQLVRNRS